MTKPVCPKTERRIGASLPRAERACVLSYQEAQQLEHNSIRPKCSRHPHIPREEADRLERDGDVLHLAYPRPYRVKWVAPCDLCHRASDGYAMLQLLPL